MSRCSKIISIAMSQALNSTQTFKHGAVITGKGGKVLCVGFNKGNRTKIMNKIYTCVHAEMDVLNKFINGYLKPKYGKNYKKHTKKYCVWVVKIQNVNSNKVSFSKPCFYCSRLLKAQGFSKVYFSYDESTIECIKINDLVSNHKSHCQLKVESVIGQSNTIISEA